MADTAPDSIRYDRQVLQQDPAFFLSHLTIAEVENIQGHAEASLRETEKAISVPSASSGLSIHGVSELRAQVAAMRDEALGDNAGALADHTTLANISDRMPERLSEWRLVAGDLAKLHDFAAASDMLERLPPKWR